MLNKNKHTQFFKRHKIEDPPHENPIEELMEIYKETERADGTQENELAKINASDGSLKNLIEENRKFHRRQTIIMTAILGIALLASAIGGFFYFAANKKFGMEQVKIEITGPEKTSIGEKIEYLINYENYSETDLNNAKILLQYPHGFIMETSEPAISNHNLELGTLKSKQAGTIKMAGKIIDDLERPQKLSASIMFNPANFNSEFSKTSSLTTFLEIPKIEFSENAPSTVNPGQKINITLQIKNKSENAFENAEILIGYPAEFNFQSAKPAPADNSNKWKIAFLAPASENNEIIIEGLFPADIKIENDEQRNRAFSIQLWLNGKDNIRYLAKEEKFSTKIIEQAVTAKLIANGSFENKNIELGNILTFSIIARNTGAQSFKDASVAMVIKSNPADILNWEEINDGNIGKIEKKDDYKQIVWTKREIQGLADFKKGDDYMITFTIPVKSLEELKKLDFSLLKRTSIVCYAYINLSPTQEATIPIIKSGEIILTLHSNIQLGQKALYYFDDGTPIGIGPYPPKAGQKTRLKIFWDLSNDLHELENISIATTLPEHSAWTDEKNASAGEISFDPTTKTVNWKINRLPESVLEAHASFGIEVIPRTIDIGKIIPLTGTTTVSATDKSTNDLIIKTKSIINSSLEQDKFVEGTGAVEK